MSSEQEQKIAKLRRLFEEGILDEEEYQAAVAAIKQVATASEGSAVAEGEGATAVAERGVSAGDVGQSVVTGDHNVVVGSGNVTVQQAPPDPAQIDPGALREAYLWRVLDEHNRLLLGGIDPKAVTADRERLRLSAVYTALLTERREGAEALPAGGQQRDGMQKETRRLSAVEQLNEEQHLVLLGDPGSGKSTFVNFAAVCLAGEAMGHEELNAGLLTTPLPAEEEKRPGDDGEKTPAPQPWDHGALLPVCITLREFAARGLPPAGQEGTAEHLWRFLENELKTAGLEKFLPLLKKEMLERGGIFMFDGLDEVPAVDQHRTQIKQVVEDIAATCRKSRILVTSRTYAYQRQDWRLPGFAETVLAPFSKEQIGYFVDRWYEQLAALQRFRGDDAQGKAALLKDAIYRSERLYDLAERPLLLTLMASLHAWRGGSLPEKREVLYSDAVDLLLDVWEQQRVVRAADGAVQVVQPSLEQWLAVDRDKVRGLLNRLAYEGHKSQPELVGTADIPQKKLAAELLELSDDLTLQPKQLVAYISNRAGLLVPRGQGIYTFPHRTFQEYLAACHLTDFNYPVAVAELARGEPNRWREVAMLAGAKAARGSDYALWGLVEELCHEEAGEGGEEAYWGAHLAGQLLFENSDLKKQTAAQKRHLDRLRGWLAQVLEEPVLPPAERALAGVHLAKLGDPRVEVMDVDAMQFCLVPGGDFWMGDGEDLDLVSFLNYDYCLAHFPVTAAQYRTFVGEDGYANKAWWAEAIAAGLWDGGAYTAYGQNRTAPWDYGAEFALGNQPVVGVSWFEALAFCRWLSARWQSAGWLPDGWQVTLPSEAEWEKGARGGVTTPEQPIINAVQELGMRMPKSSVDNPDARRPYTWTGEAITVHLANYENSDINRPNAVGCYRLAASVYGCEEMLGNVFEWTRSLYTDYPYDPGDGRERLQRKDSDRTVLRGGSWAAPGTYSRCGARLRGYPNVVSDVIGFRVA
ncbi:MAG: SUMF1/EgtB/PvdO family nonheme iron enzyme, partial [Candidatus Promineifilaceae bacterium]